MNPETFFDNFGMLADAPNGIKKLRELILQLAIQGKLVAQDENDEPAAALLEKINAEKETLVKEKKIRKSMPLHPVEIDEIRFEIPKNWKWVRFGEITFNRDGERIPVSKEERNTRERIYDYYGASGVIDKIDNYLFDKPLLLIGEDGANLINRSTPIAFIAKGKYWVNNHAHVLDGISLEFLRYIEMFINATDLTPYVTGTAQPKMNQTKMNSIPMALPPLSEQRRIVARVDQLMTLCDELEAHQKQKHEARTRLNSAALSKLTSAPDGFMKNWQTINDNFDLLYDAPETVGELRKAILQLAIMGKLVAQDETDEPASVLLEGIRCERERLIIENKIKKNKMLQFVKKDEMDSELPIGWTRCYLSEISTKITDGEHITPNRTSKGYYLLSARNVTNEGILLNDVDYVPKDEFERIRKRCNPDKGDILISCSGSVGRIAIVDKDETYVMVRSAAFVKPYLNFINNKFLAYELKSPLVQNQIIEKSKTTAQSNLFIGKIKELIIDIPPLAEQRRIVARVDQLMTLCDELEAKLAQSQADGAGLMEAVVGEMVAW